MKFSSDSVAVSSDILAIAVTELPSVSEKFS